MSAASWRRSQRGGSRSARQEARALLDLLEATGERRESLELAALEDDTVFEELELAEDALVDDALRGCLGPKEARRFDALVAVSPRLKERLAIGRALHQRAREHAARHAPARNRGWLAAAASVGLLAIGVGFLWFGSRMLPTGDRVVSSDVATEEPRGYQPQLPDVGQPSVPLLLSLHVPRGSDSILRLSRPAEGGTLEVHAEVGDEPFDSFRLALFDGRDQLRQAWDALLPVGRSGTRVVRVEIAWNDLAPGHATLLLSGETEGGATTDLAFHELEVLGVLTR